MICSPYDNCTASTSDEATDGKRSHVFWIYRQKTSNCYSRIRLPFLNVGGTPGWSAYSYWFCRFLLWLHCLTAQPLTSGSCECRALTEHIDRSFFIIFITTCLIGGLCLPNHRLKSSQIPVTGNHLHYQSCESSSLLHLPLVSFHSASPFLQPWVAC